jgi:hypothetical protein
MSPTIHSNYTSSTAESFAEAPALSLSLSSSTVSSTSSSCAARRPQHTGPSPTNKRATFSPTVEERTSATMSHNFFASLNGNDNASSTKTPSETDMDWEQDVELGKPNMSDDLPRLVLRNRPFHQSSNKVHIEHNQGYRIYSLLRHNMFHAFLRWPTSRSLPLLMVAWTGSILAFAGTYMWYDRLDSAISCGLGLIDEPMTSAAAFAFSLETCTTVGYGLPHGINSYFEDGCSSLQIIIYFQMAWSMLFNAFLLAFLYARLGRSETRGAQVICSSKALVSEVDGQVRFQVRLFDADAKHPVVEAHVRFYAVMKHRPVPRPLRLLQPDDDMGGMLFLSFPTVVNHHIDLYSLLHPPTTAMSMNPSGLVLREVDGATCGRDDINCPVCGESYGTLERWKNHVRYQQIVESQDEYPIPGTHLSLDFKEIEEQVELKASNDLNDLKAFFQNNVSEILCVVEGIDPMQSGTFQSLQSYRFEDIVWEKHSYFAPCMTVVEDKKSRKFQVDLDRYHDIVPDEEAIAAAKAAADQKQPKARPRRCKTVSRKQSDMMFSEDTA